MSVVGLRRLGIDLGGTKIEAQLFSLEGECLWRHREPTPLDIAGTERRYQDTLDTLCGLVSAARQWSDVAFTIGLATPGSHNDATGLMQNCNSTCLNGRALQLDLERRLKQPIKMANDADCMLLSEVVDGAAHGAASAFGVILGTGVGGAVAVHNQLLSGPNAICGEWGHNPVPVLPGHAMGRDCYCGKRDCLETHLSGVGLAESYRRIAGDASLVLEGKQIAASDDANCRQAMEQYFDMLAACLAQVINILDPHVIVFAGGVSRLPNLLVELEQRLPKFVFIDRLNTRLVLSQYGDASGARGAAWLWN
ncbi:N-acetylglucosamine kinase [Sinobacterium caligoides]|uniref:N-acetylglucosamine kinase n=1 Tax=Sinobacterium caligoides TaxID=933926 RepID=A0A3N2DZQ3_9GAMM|nr:ROK family protein [Sinobacterium caligoides]ROS05346.1 N-acetylglucosamine kinase [Sinobacterium caligoides]